MIQAQRAASGCAQRWFWLLPEESKCIYWRFRVILFCCSICTGCIAALLCSRRSCPAGDVPYTNRPGVAYTVLSVQVHDCNPALIICPRPVTWVSFPHAASAIAPRHRPILPSSEITWRRPFIHPHLPSQDTTDRRRAEETAMPTIPAFLVPRGLPSARSLHGLALRRHRKPRTEQCAFSTSSKRSDNPRVLEKPDKFRPPSHPARRVVQTRNGRVVGSGPVNYPGPKLSEQEKEEKRTKQYPNMFPPEGTVMHRFLTSRWIHVWISMGILTSLATFTFTTNFKSKSPFAHLLPPWSGLIWHPVDTISQALSVYRMDVQHNSMLTREKRLQRVEDAEKRRRYRVAHGLEEDISPASPKPEIDDQSPIAQGQPQPQPEGNTKPVKKWFGIW